MNAPLRFEVAKTPIFMKVLILTDVFSGMSSSSSIVNRLEA